MSLKPDYLITRGEMHDLPDVPQFLGMLSGLQDHASPELRTFFDPQGDLTIARAPGRLDVMGGIADYSGSLVLELPIAEATLVALQKQDGEAAHKTSFSKSGGWCARIRPYVRYTHACAPCCHYRLKRIIAESLLQSV